MPDRTELLLARLEELLQNVRMYVGARYVPRFIDDPWNDITSYEALDVVDNGQGTSYIARKPVPAGTPLSDRTYWFLYGSTSGAIVNLQQQIDTLTGTVNSQGQTIASQGQAITTLEGTVTTQGQTIASQGQTIASQGQAITDLGTRIDNLPLPDRAAFFAGKKIMIIGDSLSTTTTNPPSWTTLFRNEVQGYGATVSLTFCNDGDSFAGIAQRLSDFDPYINEWDIIIVALGVNDYQGQYQIGFYNSTQVVLENDYDSAAGMNLLLAKLRQKFPKALQFYCPPHRSARDIGRAVSYPLSYYRNAFGRIAQYYGMRIIDWSSMPMFAPAALGSTFGGYTTDSDVLHPTATYAPILKEYMIQKLMSGGDNDWKDSCDSVSRNLDPSLDSSSSSASLVVSSHGETQLRLAITANVSASYAFIFRYCPQRLLDVIPQLCIVNGDTPAYIEPFDGGLIIHKPAGVTTIQSIYADLKYKYANPMNYYLGILD